MPQPRRPNSPHPPGRPLLPDRQQIPLPNRNKTIPSNRRNLSKPLKCLPADFRRHEHRRRNPPCHRLESNIHDHPGPRRLTVLARNGRYASLLRKCLDSTTSTWSITIQESASNTQVKHQESATHSINRAVKSAMEAYLSSLHQELILLNSPATITSCIIGGVQTEFFHKGIGKIAKQQGAEITFPEFAINSAATPEAAGKFLVDAGARRVRYAYGPDYVAASSGEVLYYFPRVAGYVASSLPIISQELYRKVRTALVEARRRLSDS